MPTEADFNRLEDDVPEPSGSRHGLPWQKQFVIENSRKPHFRMGVQRIGEDGSNLSGTVKVDGSTSIQKRLVGPFVQHDAPTTIIPSTLFTPFPTDILGIDFEYLEFLSIVAMAAALGALAIQDTFSSVKELINGE